ncbi:serine/threonine protein kinase with WD40 repeats [Isosphaera pallida ATCC 43644]|uniref:Serine/threonine protein kinase with WD40 repeats n=2 Tax=Isosphaera pallida TaxID=128 RepID=E8R094_ISOPI|nr:serine/threonine protein kinase with WD40 repeats [Isosphaera pallida ATCC 43644]
MSDERRPRADDQESPPEPSRAAVPPPRDDLQPVPPSPPTSNLGLGFPSTAAPRIGDSSPSSFPGSGADPKRSSMPLSSIGDSDVARRGAPLESPSMAEFLINAPLHLSFIEPGQIIFGKYEVIRKLGEGGMGSVWLVRHLELDCERALKTIASNIAAKDEARQRFRREAKAMASFSHPNAVTIHDFRLAHDLAYIDMEYVRGESLETLLQPGVPMPLPWIRRIIEQLCDVLQEAHDKRIVHRDLKPSNLMLVSGRAPGRELLKVLDFGIAKIMEEAELSLTNNVFLGTAAYASPEQANGDPVDDRSDLYSMGVLLYQFLTGYRPFTGPVVKQVYDLVNTPPPPFAIRNPDVKYPPAVEAVVLKCLAKTPDARPASARALAEEFLAALDEVKTPSSVSVAIPASDPPSSSGGDKKAGPSGRPSLLGGHFVPSGASGEHQALPSWASGTHPAIQPGPGSGSGSVNPMGGPVAHQPMPGTQAPRDRYPQPVPISDEFVSRPGQGGKMIFGGTEVTVGSGPPPRPGTGVVPGLGLTAGQLGGINAQAAAFAKTHPAAVAAMAPHEAARFLTESLVLTLRFLPNTSHALAGCRDGSIRIFDLSTQRQLHDFNCPGPFSAMTISPDGRRLLGACRSQVRVFNIESGMELTRYEQHRDGVATVAVSSDGLRAISGGDDQIVRIWEVITGRTTQLLRGHISAVGAATFLDGGALAVSGGEDLVLRVWNPTNGDEVATLEGHRDWITTLAPVPRTYRVVSGGGDDSILVWDLHRMARIAALAGHAQGITALAPSPDGSWLLSGSKDHSIRLWSLSTFHEAFRFDGHEDWVTSLSWAPDQRHFLSGGRDNTVRLWKMPETLVSAIRPNRFGAGTPPLPVPPASGAAATTGDPSRKSFLSRFFGKQP